MTKRVRSLGLVSAALAMTLAATACGSDTPDPSDTNTVTPLSGAVSIDGSSTVEPLSSAVATLYNDIQPGVQVAVGTSGTGAGFEKFCNGETDISDASRAIEDDEVAACTAKGITFTELLVANDALSVVVHPSNDWATCLTVDELKAIWDQGSTVTNWNQVKSTFPDKPLGQNELFGPGVDSGTFDYFTAEINGEEQRSRTNYTASEDDNVLVNGVTEGANALGYFGYSHYISNQARLKVLEVDGGDGCVAPSPETVADASYTPLARPLYIYVNNASKSKPQVVDFVTFYVDNLTEATEEAFFVPLTSDQQTDLDADFASFTG